MKIKKIAIAALFAILPPLSIILTVPFISLSEHIGHLLLFAILGVCMAGYILRSDIAQVKPKKMPLSPSFTTIIFALCIVFAFTHSMPCPYMFSSQTAQTMIDHPCSQPTTSGIATIVFIPIIMLLGIIAITIPGIMAFTLIQTTDSRSPPFI